jgi:hypothetical protein
MFLHSNFLLEKTQCVFGTPSNFETLIIQQTGVKVAKVIFHPSIKIEHVALKDFS